MQDSNTENAKRQITDLEKSRFKLLHKIDVLQKSKLVLQAKIDAQAQKSKQEHEIYAATHKDDKKHIDVLERNLNAIYASFSWKVMGPYRRLRKLLLPPSVKLEEVLVDEDAGDAVCDQTSDKAQFDAVAMQNMDLFLRSDAQLQFPDEAAPRVSILLVFYNQAHLSLSCLESILEHPLPPFELIVVDNDSTDRTPELLEKLDNVKIIRNTENLGFVKAVNQGAAAARGEYLLLLNNDATLHVDAIDRALEPFTEAGGEKVGAVGGKILLLDGTLQEAGSVIFNEGSCLGYGRHAEPDDPDYMFRREVDYCSGAFLLLDLGIFRKLGGFDEQFAPAYYEESDYCTRLIENGYSIIYEPRAVITHYEFASTGGKNNATELQAKHRALYCSKHQDFLSGRLPPDPSNALSARSANDFPNVLMIDDRVPHSILGAGYPRCNEIIRYISGQEFNLTFYPLVFPSESWNETYRSIPANVEVMLDKGADGLLDFLRARRGFYQYIMISRIHNMETFNCLLQDEEDLLAGVNIVYDAEALTSPREQMAKRMAGLIVTEEEEEMALCREIGHASSASVVLAVSEKEARIYERYGVEHTEVLGHKVEIDLTPEPFENRDGFLFIGALRDDNSPNVDSLIWFCNEIFPLILEQLPSAKVTVIGDNSASRLADLSIEGVEFLGSVELTRCYYAASRVFIAPTRFAAGIPHKIHEAAGTGLPCVATQLLADQLGWLHDQDLLVGDDSAEFARACVRLHQDAGLWNKLRTNAASRIELECSSSQFNSTLLGVLDKVDVSNDFADSSITQEAPST